MRHALLYLESMADDADTLVLEILKDVQSRLVQMSRRMENWEVRQESLLADHLALKRDGVRQDESIAHPHVRQDRMEAEVNRINARLGLIDPDLH